MTDPSNISATPSSLKSSRNRSLQFPSHNAPRVWFLMNGSAPMSVALAEKLLDHGDYVIAGVLPIEFEKRNQRSNEFRDFLERVKNSNRWRERLRVVGLDGRIIGQCQAAVVEATEAFGRIDILLTGTSEVVIGAVEEFSQSQRALGLVREQFEWNLFANVNIIKAVLPCMRTQKNGHIIVLTGITSHIGTPGLGMYCASQWAIEGYCDSLAYEIAPFNIKMTIIQPGIEVNLLTNRMTSIPPMHEYSADSNIAPLARQLFSGILSKLEGNDSPRTKATRGNGLESLEKKTYIFEENNSTSPPTSELLLSGSVETLYPPVAPHIQSALIAETTHALTAIGGHDNPPARHIVSFEGVASVKEKLKTVSEELEDFIEVSGAADIGKGTDVGGFDS